MLKHNYVLISVSGSLHSLPNSIISSEDSSGSISLTQKTSERLFTKKMQRKYSLFQSLHSGCEGDPIDLEGLHESVVDSDEDLADSMDVSGFNLI